MMSWTHAVSAILPDIRGIPCKRRPGRITFSFSPQNATYARFEVKSFYGSGGGLQYFEIAGPPEPCKEAGSK